MDQETIKLIIKLVIVLVVIGAIYAVYVKIRASIRKVKRSLGQFSEVMNTIKAADEEQMHTPKTLSGVESIHLKRIMKDFPEFNPSLAKTYIKSFVNEYFAAMKAHRTDLGDFEDTCSRQFIELMTAQFADTASTTYSQVKVHKLVISDYKKTNDEADIYFQLALQYVPSSTNRLTQEKYTVTYSYFIETGAQGEMASIICSHCGAPINTLGAKVCPYCDSAVAAVSVDRTWKVTDLRRTTY